MNSNPSTPNPSLNDILKPILEAKGWRLSAFAGNIANYCKEDPKTTLIQFSGEVFMGVNNGSAICLSPADPLFLEKLEGWLMKRAICIMCKMTARHSVQLPSGQWKGPVCGPCGKRLQKSEEKK